VKFAFIRGHRDIFDVDVMCGVLRVTTSGFYAWLKRPESPRAGRARELTRQIRVVHQESRRVYGSIKVQRELLRRGGKVNRKTVARLMRAAGIKAKVCKKFRVRTTDSNHGNPVAPNLLDRRFAVADLDRVWATDITYIHTDEGVLYLAGIMDLCSRKIIGWSMSDSMTADLVLRALDMAIAARRPDPGLLHHSDRGVQYTCGRYRASLSSNEITASMSRTGDCYDNAVVESFWGKLKNEMTHHEHFATQAQARAAIFDYIEVFYNRQRLHAALGYVSPEEFEASRRRS
jgi:transposase InsO family protein